MNPNQKRLVSLQEEEEIAEKRPCEGTVRRQLSASQEESSLGTNPGTLILDF